jgi:hypothetical protein
MAPACALVRPSRVSFTRFSKWISLLGCRSEAVTVPLDWGVRGSPIRIWTGYCAKRSEGLLYGAGNAGHIVIHRYLLLSTR